MFVWYTRACVGHETRKGTMEVEREREGNGRYMACWDAGARRRAAEREMGREG